MTAPDISLDGSWQLIRAEHAGESAPDMVVEQTIVRLTRGQYSVSYAGRVVDRGTFEIGGVVEQTTLVLRGQVGPNAGRTIPCIYQLRGDRLRVCYGFGGKAPTEFTTDSTNQRYLGVYRRI
jgi:uncharacterized protein (TIGR03067 family)